MDFPTIKRMYCKKLSWGDALVPIGWLCSHCTSATLQLNKFLFPTGPPRNLHNAYYCLNLANVCLSICSRRDHWVAKLLGVVSCPVTPLQRDKFQRIFCTIGPATKGVQSFRSPLPFPRLPWVICGTPLHCQEINLPVLWSPA